MPPIVHDRDACEYPGSGRIDFASVRYFRPTLWDNYGSYCDVREIHPGAMKSFRQRLLEATEVLGWRGVHVSNASYTRRCVIRGIRFRFESRWIGEYADKSEKRTKAWSI